MRIIRIPYVYLPSKQVSELHRNVHTLLETIKDVHLGIPNVYQTHPDIQNYLLYPSFLRWVHDKCATEMKRRGMNHKSPLSQEIRELKSRSLDYFLPPDDIEIAQDVVYLLHSWRLGKYPGGKELPWSYVELAREKYGYSPSEAYLEGTREVPRYHYNADAGWYHI